MCPYMLWFVMRLTARSTPRHPAFKPFLQWQPVPWRRWHHLFIIFLPWLYFHSKKKNLGWKCQSAQQALLLWAHRSSSLFLLACRMRPTTHTPPLSIPLTHTHSPFFHSILLTHTHTHLTKSELTLICKNWQSMSPREAKQQNINKP